MSITTGIELFKVLAEQTGLTQLEIKSVFKAYGEIIEEMNTDGDKVLLPGLGNFKVTLKEARTGRNPSSGEVISIPARLGYKFAFTGIKNKFKG